MIRRTALKLHNSIGHSHTHRFVHSYQATQRNQHLASISKQIEASNMKALDIIKQNNAALSDISDKINTGNLNVSYLLGKIAKHLDAANTEYVKAQAKHNNTANSIIDDQIWFNMWICVGSLSLFSMALHQQYQPDRVDN